MIPKFRWAGFWLTLTMIITAMVIIGKSEVRDTKNPIIGKSTPQGILKAELDRKIKRRAEGYAKPDQPEKFDILHREIRTRYGKALPDYPMGYKQKEMIRAGIMREDGSPRLTMQRGFSSTLDWTSRGPSNFLGRARGLVVDPDDANHLTYFIGSVGGGIWKTTNAGVSWVNKTPEFPNLSTTVLAMSASDHDIMYAGTGEGYQASVGMIKGDGIFKSTDRGENWSQLSSTSANEDFAYVNRIIVDPNEPETVVAATNKGILKTTNGGTTWTKVYDSPSRRIQQVIADPSDFDIQYASANAAGFLKSTNAGDTWVAINDGFEGGGRAELAIAPSEPTTLFASVENSNSEVYMSTNSGASWNRLLDTTGATSTNWLGSQGWYDNTIAVHPYDPNVIFVGGINVWQIKTSRTVEATVIREADTTGTSSFLAFTNFSLGYMGGGIGNGVAGFGSTDPIGLENGDSLIDVEVRFGPGLRQWAYRFETEAQGAGQTSSQYIYKDSVYVPFQAWDVTSNRQISICFRDEDRNGRWDLTLSPADGTTYREYIFINAASYDSTMPVTQMKVNGGMKYRVIMEIGPALPTGATWDPNAVFPTSKIWFKRTSTVAGHRATTMLTNWYAGLSRPSGGTFPFIHADQHNIVTIPISAPNNFWLLHTNDGGFARSTDGGSTWIFNEEIAKGMVTAQFYGADKKPGASAYIGGTQDNGTWRSGLNPTVDSAWSEMLGGDGYDAVWKANDGNQLIGCLYDNRLYKSTNGGQTWASSTNGLLDVDNANSAFVTEIARSKIDPDLLLVPGGSGIWRSEDFGDSWSLAPITSNYGFSSARNLAEISLADPNVAWAGTNMSAAGKLHVSTNAGKTFTATVNYNGATMGRVTGIATHPYNKNEAFALFSIANGPKILRTMDLGQTWTDISGFNGNVDNSSNGFPDVATYSLLVLPTDTNEIWAGTEIGIFRSTDNGATWAYANNGLPAVSVWELKVVDDEIVAATHGRGVWTTPISAPPLPTPTLSPVLRVASQSPSTGSVVIKIDLRSVYDSTVVLLGNSRVAVLGTNSVKDTTISFATTVVGATTFKAKSYKNGILYESGTKSATLVQAIAPQATYYNQFNVSSSDFTGDLFAVSTVNGFSTGALHTVHNYVDNTNKTSQLNIPITVAQDSSMLVFDEIALIEPGEDGFPFGTEEFYDYVIVEGTSDGVNWVPLLDGWDARDNSTWLNVYLNGGSINSSLFKKRRINLKDTFNSGTSVYIRFRMYTDAGSTGWGWCVDNLKINVDESAPTVTVGALASPVVNVVKFAVGANRPLASALLNVQSTSVPLTRQGALFFGSYTISTSGTLNVVGSGADSTGNPSNVFNKQFTVTSLSKPSALDGYTVSGTGNGFVVANLTTVPNPPTDWVAIGTAFDAVITGTSSNLSISYVLPSDDQLDVILPEKSDRSKIGLYEYDGKEWRYLGRETDGKLKGQFAQKTVAAFYNPDFAGIPTEFALSQNYPNPFNPRTTIRYDVAAPGKVVIKVYNMLGQEVATLINAQRDPGRYYIQWDGRNNAGSVVASGVYLYRMQVGNVVRSKRMLFLK